MDSKNKQVIEELEGQHFDIGLVGLWYGANYGSVITYYALYHTLVKLGYSVLMVDKVIRKNARPTPELDAKVHSMIFAHQHYPHIAPSLTPEDTRLLNQYCDTFLVGSDQVWNYAIARNTCFNNYLYFADDTKKLISYAASFGHGQSFTPLEDVARVTQYLQRFDHVSVREDSGVEILWNEYGVEGTQVLDPVFLLNQAEYDEILADATAKEDERYMLSYILDPTEETRKVLLSIAKKKNLKLLNMLDGRGDRQKNMEILNLPNIIEDLDTPNWLWYIRHAEYVVTDSCHGASFALKFHRPFVCITNPKRGAQRMQSLFTTFGLMDRLVDNIKNIKNNECLLGDIDYSLVDTIMEMEQQRSINWLTEALADAKELPASVVRVPKKECSGCGACYNSCPVDAITMQYDEEGILYPVVKEETCIHCKKCVKACPALKPVTAPGAEPAECYAAYADTELRKVSSSGGIFGTVADYILENGGAVCGAAFDERQQLSHCVVESKEDLPKLCGSKYVQSDTKRTYTQIRQILEEGRPALYVGCPCQIAGLKGFLGKEYDKLFTIDLLCHGSPSPVVFERYLEEIHNRDQIEYVGFRDKDHFKWEINSTGMTVRYKNGKTYRRIKADDLFYRVFTPAIAVRPQCQSCHYAHIPRQGDFTLGDFWGVKKYDEKLTDGMGTSVVAVNTVKGQEMLAMIKDRLLLLEPIKRDYLLKCGQPYAKPYRTNPARYTFLRLNQHCTVEKSYQASVNQEYDFAIYGMNAESYGSILAYYAIYQTVLRCGYTSAMVERPADLGEKKVTPLKYRAKTFGNRYYPVVWKHLRRDTMGQLNANCHGYVTAETLRYPQFADGNKKSCTITELEALYLLTREDYVLFAKHAKKVPEKPYIAMYCDIMEENVAQSIQTYAEEQQLDIMDLSQDMEVEQWLAYLCNAEFLVTDKDEGRRMAAICGIELAVIADENNNPDLQKRHEEVTAHLVTELQTINRIFEKSRNSLVKRGIKKALRVTRNLMPSDMKKKVKSGLKKSGLYNKVKKSL